MILNTGNRTDIPAFYSKWFYRRVAEGYVLARNPYNKQQVTRYLLDPEVVDCITFCTKNPEPMLSGLENIRKFRQFWSVTITPHGKDIEPFVPEPCEVMESFADFLKKWEESVSAGGMIRFFCRGNTIEIFISKAFPKWRKNFRDIQAAVSSVLSTFMKRRRKNFPGVQTVKKEDRLFLGETFCENRRGA